MSALETPGYSESWSREPRYILMQAWFPSCVRARVGVKFAARGWPIPSSENTHEAAKGFHTKDSNHTVGHRA